MLVAGVLVTNLGAPALTLDVEMFAAFDAAGAPLPVRLVADESAVEPGDIGRAALEIVVDRDGGEVAGGLHGPNR